MVQWMGVPLHVDAFLPLTEALQGVVCMVCDLQVLLVAESTAMHASLSSRGSGPVPQTEAGEGHREGQWVDNGQPASPSPASSLTTPWSCRHLLRGPEKWLSGTGE